ncbi:hypothetical protein RJ641_029635 [Dillenia turbinata]|uniref:Uncharacterized protein n=1 Tax=Dillenia turbinata TaxID=194707 RepID=A0AAN8VU04_9MAGN
MENVSQLYCRNPRRRLPDTSDSEFGKGRGAGQQLPLPPAPPPTPESEEDDQHSEELSSNEDDESLKCPFALLRSSQSILEVEFWVVSDHKPRRQACKGDMEVDNLNKLSAEEQQY